MSEKEINQILETTRNLYSQGFSILNKANKILHDGIYKYPDNLSLRLALAAQMASTGNYHDSIELYQTILKISSNDPYALTGLGNIYFEIGKFSESFKLATLSLDVRDMPETRLLICRHYLSQGKLQEVQNHVDEILKKFPENENAILLNQRLQHIKSRDDQPETLR